MSKTRSLKHPLHFQAVNKSFISTVQEWLLYKTIWKRKTSNGNEQLVLSKMSIFLSLIRMKFRSSLKKKKNETSPRRVGATN